PRDLRDVRYARPVLRAAVVVAALVAIAPRASAQDTSLAAMRVDAVRTARLAQIDRAGAAAEAATWTRVTPPRDCATTLLIMATALHEPCPPAGACTAQTIEWISVAAAGVSTIVLAVLGFVRFFDAQAQIRALRELVAPGPGALGISLRARF